MSFANPTALRVGAQGTLHGWTVSVAGRVVLGVEISGQRYYWNEYHLVDSAGNPGTLVYEEGDEGPEWKLFQQLTPRKPMSISEAESKRVGDRVSFGGAAIAVTLVDRSRVYHIEGTAPEGVEVGDLADFFNADAGDHMIVASWTGDEIEFYEGRDVPAETIATAFRLPRGARGVPAPASTGVGSPNLVNRWVAGVLVVLAIAAGLAGYAWLSRRGPTGPVAATAPAKPAIPALQLRTGASGALDGQAYAIGSQALVEVGRVGGVFGRREYHLAGDNEKTALLVNGLTGGSKQWHLLRPVPIPAGFTAFDAAARRKGSMVQFGAAKATVSELFLSQPRQREGAQAEEGWPEGNQYGFVAIAGGDWWLARWDEHRLALYRGIALNEQAVLLALGPGPEKPK